MLQLTSHTQLPMHYSSLDSLSVVHRYISVSSCTALLLSRCLPVSKTTLLLSPDVSHHQHDYDRQHHRQQTEVAAAPQNDTPLPTRLQTKEEKMKKKNKD